MSGQPRWRRADGNRHSLPAARRDAARSVHQRVTPMAWAFIRQPTRAPFVRETVTTQNGHVICRP
jgi:hypothetical protein